MTLENTLTPAREVGLHPTVRADNPGIATVEFPVIKSDVESELQILRRNLKPNILDCPENLVRMALGQSVDIIFLGDKEAELVQKQHFTSAFGARRNSMPRLHTKLRTTEQMIETLATEGFDEHLLERFQVEDLLVYRPFGQGAKIVDGRRPPKYLIVVEPVNYKHREEDKIGYVARAHPSKRYQQELLRSPIFDGLIRKVIDTSIAEVFTTLMSEPEVRFNLTPNFLIERTFREQSVMNGLLNSPRRQRMLEIACDSLIEMTPTPPPGVVEGLRKAKIRLKSGDIRTVVNTGNFKNNGITWNVTDPNAPEPPQILVNYNGY